MKAARTVILVTGLALVAALAPSEESGGGEALPETPATEEELDLELDGALDEDLDALLDETSIRCLGESLGLDRIESKGNELTCRFALKDPNGGRKFILIAGLLPKLYEKKALLKLKEIIRFLKIYDHGK